MHDIFNIKKYNNLVRPIDKKNNFTAIHHAVRIKKNDVIVEYLLSLGLNINYQTAHSGWTPLMSAVCNECFEVAHLLLANGADKKRTNTNGRTALDMALYRNRTAIIHLLE